jgi:hypothetical protein
MLRLSSPQLDPTGVGSLKLLLAVRCTELNRGFARALSPRSRPQCIAPLSTATSHVARGSEAKSSRMLGNSRALVADPIPPTGSLPTFTICSCGDRDEDGHGNQLNGELGETLVKAAIQGLGHVFEGRGRLETGVDGTIEFRDPATGCMLGKTVAVQVKTTASGKYVREDDAGFEYVLRIADLDYWHSTNLPVIIVLQRLSDRSIY